MSTLRITSAQVSSLQRIGEPVEGPPAAVWLSSDSASFVTGTVVPVDGGHTAR